MRCPFLREAQVKSCCASPYKKMIARTSDQNDAERCSHSEWKLCPASKQHFQESPPSDRCPFLQESLVQYCSAIPIPKYVPYSDAPHLRCANDGHAYCEEFVSMAHAGRPQTDGPVNCCTTSDKADVRYSQNHMWFDIHENKTCHIGIDAFLATFLCNVDRVSFVSTRTVCQPTVVLSVRGIDLSLTFPEKIQVTEVNAYLRARPSTLTTHPYTLGWLFEGVRTEQPPGSTVSSMGLGLIRNDQARRWLKRESKRMTDYVRGELMAGKSRGFATMTDGGVWSEDLITHLTREETLRVWNEFFSVAARSPQPDD